MSEWYLEFDKDSVLANKPAVPLQKKKLIVGRNADCDIIVPSKSVSRNHAKIEIQRSGLIITDLGSSNGTFVNEVKIKETTSIQTGDVVRVGRERFSVKNEREHPAQKINPTLFFPQENRRKKISTLPFYITYNKKEKKVGTTLDPYNEENLLKIDLDANGFYCRNIVGAHNVSLNNIEFKQLGLNNGDKISVEQTDMIFETNFGSQTGLSEADEYWYGSGETKKGRAGKIYALVAAVLIVLVIAGYFMYPLLEIDSSAKWLNIASQLNKQIKNSSSVLEQSFVKASGFINDVHYIFRPFNIYKKDYFRIRGTARSIEQNLVLKMAVTSMAPGVLESLNQVFVSLDKLYEVEAEVKHLHNLQSEFETAVLAVTDSSSRTELQNLRSVAAEVNPLYMDITARLKDIIELEEKIQEIRSTIIHISDLDVLSSLDEALTETKQEISLYYNTFYSLQDLSNNIMNIIPE